MSSYLEYAILVRMPAMKKKQKKQILVKDPLLWNQLKGKLIAKDTTISEWFENKAREEVFGKLEE